MAVCLGGHPAVACAAAETGSAWLEVQARSPTSRCPRCFPRTCSHVQVTGPRCPCQAAHGLGSRSGGPLDNHQRPGGSIPHTRGPSCLHQMLQLPQLPPVNAPSTSRLNLSGWLPSPPAPPAAQRHSPLSGPLRASLGLPVPCLAQSLVFEDARKDGPWGGQPDR